MPDIRYVKYNFSEPLTRREGPAKGIVLHHAVMDGGPLAIHRVHLNVGYAGIGYHFYVRKDGRIYRGRPAWAMGAHCLGHNDWLGICAEGNFSEEHMSLVQKNALRWLVRHVQAVRGNMPVQPHRAMSGNATACPGTHYPVDYIKS